MGGAEVGGGEAERLGKVKKKMHREGRGSVAGVPRASEGEGGQGDRGLFEVDKLLK